MLESRILKFMFFKKATKIDEIFTINLTLCGKSQIDGENFVNFRGLLRKCELYQRHLLFKNKIPVRIAIIQSPLLFPIRKVDIC